MKKFFYEKVYCRREDIVMSLEDIFGYISWKNGQIWTNGRERPAGWGMGKE